MTGLPNGFLDRGEYKDVSCFIQKQQINGMWCDEPLLRSVCTVIGKGINIIYDDGYQTPLHPQSDSSGTHDAPLVVGLMMDLSKWAHPARAPFFSERRRFLKYL